MSIKSAATTPTDDCIPVGLANDCSAANSARASQVIELSERVEFNMHDAYYEHATSDHFWIQWRFEMLEQLLADYDLGERILEVGCGNGVVQQQFENALDRPVQGCDLNVRAMRMGGPSRGQRYLYNVLDERVDWRDHFETVLLLDTLEHIDWPVEFLRAIGNHLQPRGLIVINVPAMPALYSRYDAVQGHVKRYTRKQLEHELSQSGFELLAHAYWGGNVVPIAFLRKLLVNFADRDDVLTKGFAPPSKLAGKDFTLSDETGNVRLQNTSLWHIPRRRGDSTRLQRGGSMSNDSKLASSEVALSFVVPVYNELAVFDQLAQRLRATMDQASFSCEVVLVDDGSSDGTRDRIDALCQADERFSGVMLSRNFGHQRAVSAGLDYARGEAVGILDGDLQDPPELLLEFHAKLSEGYDVVYAVRENRKEGMLKRFCYWAFYRLLRRFAAVDIPLDSGDFCLMSRSVVDQIRSMPERHRFIRGMRSWIGYRQTGVSYDRNARQAGESKYTISKLFLLALDGLMTFSEVPLRLSTFCGVGVATFAMLWGGYIMGWRLIGGAGSLPGFATMACGMFFLGGVQLICLGILGEYVARIHNEVKGRPIYVVQSVVSYKRLESPDTESSHGEMFAESISLDESLEDEITAELNALLPTLSGSHGGTQDVEQLLGQLQDLE